MNLEDILKISKRPLTFNGLTRQEIQSHPVYQNYGEAFQACAKPRIPTKEMLKRKIPSSVLESMTDEKLLCIFCNHLMQVPIIVKTCGHKFCEECIEKYRLSYNSKNCPQCRARIASKREFQLDNNLQKLSKMESLSVEKVVRKPNIFQEKLSKLYGENYQKAMEDGKKHPSKELRIKHIKNRGTLRGRKKFTTQQEESESSSSEQEDKSEEKSQDSEKENNHNSRLRPRKATNPEKEEPSARKKKKYYDHTEIVPDLEITLEQIPSKKSKCKLQRAKLTVDRRMSLLQFKKYLALKNQIQADQACQFVVLLECPDSEVRGNEQQERFSFVDDSFRFVDFLELKSKDKGALPSTLSVFYDATKLFK